MRDPERYRSVDVNRDLTRVYKGDTLIGQVRRGLDNAWYAEIGDGVRGRIVAMHQLILAHQAIEEAERVLNG